MKILVIDDQPVAARLLRSVVASAGHECEMVENPHAALDLLADGAFRVVVSDWKMPGMDGLELCAHVRLRPGRYTYFLLVSAQSVTKEAQKRAYQVGVDDFLRKPVDPDEMAMKLHVAERILRMTDQLVRFQGLVPTCRSCQGLRHDEEFWQDFGALLHRHRAEGSVLDLCPGCRGAVPA